MDEVAIGHRSHLEDERVGRIIAGAREIYVSACASEIGAVPGLLRAYARKDATVTGIFSPLVNRQSYAGDNLRVRTFLLNGPLTRDMNEGRIDFCPWRYGEIDRYLSAPGRFDASLVMVAPPDRDGNCSLGVQADFLPSFHHGVDRLVGFVNPRMPRTSGHAQIGIDRFDALVDYDMPLNTMTLREPDDAAVTIARNIVNLVPANATVQFGVGQIPSQVIAALSGHRGLRIHTGVVDDNILGLAASGALDPDHAVVTGTAVGSTAFYDSLDGDERFLLKPVAYTHNHAVIAATPRFIAVNSVLQVDLFGQASAETSAGRWVATPGGLPDFVRGALASEGGMSIIAVRAWTGRPGARGIVTTLQPPHAVTSLASDADIIVTEFGVARVRDLPADRRAEAIIAIADPDQRDELARQWRQMMAEGFRPRESNSGRVSGALPQ